MSDLRELPRVQAVDPSLVRWTHVIYGLHAIAVIVGVASAAATVAGGFVFGLPSLAAVVIPSRFSARARTSTAVSSAGPCAPASPEASTRHEQIKVFPGRIAQNAGCPASNAILFIDAGSLAARFVPLPTQECVGAAMRMEHAGH